MVSFPTPGFLIIAFFFRIVTHIIAPQKLSYTNKMKIIPYASYTTLQNFIRKNTFKNVIYTSLQVITAQHLVVQRLIETFDLKLVDVKPAIQTN
jgi:hypothetical protein